MISVIIPTRNRAAFLRDALASIEQQIMPIEDFEVLVVDNASTDDTSDVVAHCQSRLSNCRYFYEPIPGLHVGRHRGLREAKGDILVYADDDIEALPSWLAAIKEGFSDPDVVMVGGNNLPKFLEAPPSWLLRLWEPSKLGVRAIGALSILELPGESRLFNPHNVWGCNLSIRKTTLVAAGGFHPDGFPPELIRFRGDGESYLSRYVLETGGKCLFHSKATVFHKITPDRMSFAYIRQRFFSQGISDSYAVLRRCHLGEREFTSAQSLTRRFRGVLGGVRQHLRAITTGYKDFLRLRRASRDGYREGYSYHQQAFASDPEVRAWVLKKDYL